MKALLLCMILALAAVPAAADSAPAPERSVRQGAKLYGDAGRGKDIVGRWCVGCHSAGSTLNDRIPSFPALAINLQRSEGAVRAFLMQPHEPMPPLELSTQQIEDIIAFLRATQPGSAQSPGP